MLSWLYFIVKSALEPATENTVVRLLILGLETP